MGRPSSTWTEPSSPERRGGLRRPFQRAVTCMRGGWCCGASRPDWSTALGAGRHGQDREAVLRVTRIGSRPSGTSCTDPRRVIDPASSTADLIRDHRRRRRCIISASPEVVGPTLTSLGKPRPSPPGPPSARTAFSGDVSSARTGPFKAGTHAQGSASATELLLRVPTRPPTSHARGGRPCGPRRRRGYRYQRVESTQHQPPRQQNQRAGRVERHHHCPVTVCQVEEGRLHASRYGRIDARAAAMAQVASNRRR